MEKQFPDKTITIGQTENNMSIQKFEGSFAKHDGGVTPIPNKTILAIRNPATIGIYCYLCTKPATWKINSLEIQKHFNIGRDRVRSAINELMELNLLKKKEIKVNGRFTGNHYTLYLEACDSEDEMELPSPGIPSPDLPLAVSTTHINNRYIHNIEVEKKDIITISENDILSAYHEVLPDSPKVRIVDQRLGRQLKKMQKNWPKYSASGQAFTLDGFKGFLLAIKQRNPGFLRPYTTESGNTRQNGLRTLTSETNIAKIINDEFNFS